MVEAPSNRVMVVAVTFLAIYASLTAFIPYQLLSSGAPSNFREATYADFYESSELESLANTFVQNITYGGGFYSDFWGTEEDFGHSFYYITRDTTSLNQTWRMSNEHYFPFYFIIEWKTGSHYMDWIAKDTGETFNNYITNLDFNSVSETSDQGGYDLTLSRFLVRCDHLTMHATVFFNATLYANSTEAWENDGLRCEFAIEWNELGTGLNGWNLLSALLWFQAPDVHPVVNFFIAFPVWVDIALIMFKILMVTLDVIIPL